MGALRLATSEELENGSAVAAAVTPDKLAALEATEGRKGLIKIATDAEVLAGADAASAVTPAALESRVATVNKKGLVQRATQAEADAGADEERYMTPALVKRKIDAVVGSAPGALDTLNELAEALGDDPNFATTITNRLAAKPDETRVQELIDDAVDDIPAGPKGEQGDRGPRGYTGATGAQGPRGLKGDKGDTANITVGEREIVTGSGSHTRITGYGIEKVGDRINLRIYKTKYTPPPISEDDGTEDDGTEDDGAE